MTMRSRPGVVVAGIFVGGESRRMGGRPKGLLEAPHDGTPWAKAGESIVLRWRRLFDAMGVESVLVGRREAYADLGLEGLDDDPPGIGPLGGLIALLSRAREGTAFTVACDMPRVSARLLAKLVEHAGPSPAVAPKRGGVWEPLFARYEGPLPLEIARKHAAAGGRSLFGVLDALDADTLAVTEQDLEELEDWDTEP
jgi:molybdopterin-guanine dinucleotide biosynthesis protein A